MHNDSLPPSDRPEPRACDPDLIQAIKATKLTNADIGRGMGYNAGSVSTYLNNKYGGNHAAFETAAREWLRDLTVASTTGVPTIETELSRIMLRRLEDTRTGRELTLMVGAAGIGKSRGTVTIFSATSVTCSGGQKPMISPGRG